MGIKIGLASLSSFDLLDLLQIVIKYDVSCSMTDNLFKIAVAVLSAMTMES